MRTIAAIAEELTRLRGLVSDKELGLQKAVMELFRRSTVRELADKLAISEGYVTDIRMGRRKISAALVEKLKELK